MTHHSLGLYSPRRHCLIGIRIPIINLRGGQTVSGLKWGFLHWRPRWYNIASWELFNMGSGNAWWPPVIILTNIDSSSEWSCGIRQRAFCRNAQDVNPLHLTTGQQFHRKCSRYKLMSLKITILKFQPHLPGVSELNWRKCSSQDSFRLQSFFWGSSEAILCTYLDQPKVTVLLSLFLCTDFDLAQGYCSSKTISMYWPWPRPRSLLLLRCVLLLLQLL